MNPARAAYIAEDSRVRWERKQNPELIHLGFNGIIVAAIAADPLGERIRRDRLLNDRQWARLAHARELCLARRPVLWRSDRAWFRHVLAQLQDWSADELAEYGPRFPIEWEP